jgi:SET domain-containing protein
VLCPLQRRAGAKGFGLFALEDLQAGQFIIEYIGEVCSHTALPLCGLL